MVKETSNKPRKSIQFNEQVNAILLIMFLTVALIISLKGCGKCFISKTHDIKNEQVGRNVAEADSTENDSIIIVQ